MSSERETFSKNPHFVKNLFNSISANYDKLNDIMSFGMHKRIKTNVIKAACNVLASPGSPLTFLDLCTGTGDLAGLLRKEYPNAKIIGVDFSQNMLEIARKKHPGIEFIESDITNLPFNDKSFDLCVISFGLRNVENMQKALEEIYRVLKKDGIFINLDLSKPSKFLNLFLKPYMYLWIAFLGKIFHGNETPYKYLAHSNETFPSSEELVQIYEKIGFINIKTKNYLFGQMASQISKK